MSPHEYRQPAGASRITDPCADCGTAWGAKIHRTPAAPDPFPTVLAAIRGMSRR